MALHIKKVADPCLTYFTWWMQYFLYFYLFNFKICACSFVLVFLENIPHGVCSNCHPWIHDAQDLESRSASSPTTVVHYSRFTSNCMCSLQAFYQSDCEERVVRELHWNSSVSHHSSILWKELPNASHCIQFKSMFLLDVFTAEMFTCCHSRKHTRGLLKRHMPIFNHRHFEHRKDAFLLVFKTGKQLTVTGTRFLKQSLPLQERKKDTNRNEKSELKLHIRYRLNV